MTYSAATCACEDSSHGQRVLELGSGIGIAGLSAALAGAAHLGQLKHG